MADRTQEARERAEYDLRVCREKDDCCDRGECYMPEVRQNARPDSRRYSALGDAVTASVAEWIGRRLIASTKEAA